MSAAETRCEEGQQGEQRKKDTGAVHIGILLAFLARGGIDGDGGAGGAANGGAANGGPRSLRASGPTSLAATYGGGERAVDSASKGSQCGPVGLPAQHLATGTCAGPAARIAF